VLLRRRRTSTPLLNPTLVTIVLVGGLLVASGASYGEYASATSPLTMLLAPAVAALAIPLHRERDMLRRYAKPLALGAGLGALTAAAVGYAGALALHLAPAWSLALTSRSATSPISIALASELHGAAALSAVVSILAGVLGATIGPRWLDLVLVPLVGFDPRGHRLGMGAGLYDRHFAFLRHRHAWRRPLLVGVAFDAQKVERLADSEHDVQLHGVVTERGVYGRIADR
jgi:putative effector of murein hydrolase